MDLNALATEIAKKVVHDTAFWTAVVGLIGVLIGALITSATAIALHWLKEQPQKKLDNKRKATLMQMLEDPRFEWRKLETLARIVGADDETTKRLLIEIGARGSENKSDLWALMTRKPLGSTEL